MIYNIVDPKGSQLEPKGAPKMPKGAQKPPIRAYFHNNSDIIADPVLDGAKNEPKVARRSQNDSQNIPKIHLGTLPGTRPEKAP